MEERRGKIQKGHVAVDRHHRAPLCVWNRAECIYGLHLSQANRHNAFGVLAIESRDRIRIIVDYALRVFATCVTHDESCYWQHVETEVGDRNSVMRSETKTETASSVNEANASRNSMFFSGLMRLCRCASNSMTRSSALKRVLSTPLVSSVLFSGNL